MAASVNDPSRHPELLPFMAEFWQTTPNNMGSAQQGLANAGRISSSQSAFRDQLQALQVQSRALQDESRDLRGLLQTFQGQLETQYEIMVQTQQATMETLRCQQMLLRQLKDSESVLGSCRKFVETNRLSESEQKTRKANTGNYLGDIVATLLSLIVVSLSLMECPLVAAVALALLGIYFIGRA